jgi:hypothetical protein
MKYLICALLIWLSVLVAAPVVQATGQVLGVHILHPYEINDAAELLESVEGERWRYVTIPLSLNDLEKHDEWQGFFLAARDKKILPVVRLTSRFENGAWAVPNRKNITDEIAFLSKLEWPTEQRHIIAFNEVNHAKEWGNRIDPAEYAQVFRFTAEWARSEDKHYVVMPAGMDLAAPNGRETREAFTYLNQMLASDPEILQLVDIWNSHSYPNPGFSSSPTRTAQNSLRGFEHELKWLKQKTGRDYQVLITETGWVSTAATRRQLEEYYTYALQNIWSHPQVIGVTPFLLRGDPGPFSGFSFLDKNNQPTQQWVALQRAMERVQ